MLSARRGGGGVAADSKWRTACIAVVAVLELEVLRNKRPHAQVAQHVQGSGKFGLARPLGAPLPRRYAMWVGCVSRCQIIDVVIPIHCSNCSWRRPPIVHLSPSEPLLRLPTIPHHGFSQVGSRLYCEGPSVPLHLWRPCRRRPVYLDFA